MRKEDYLEMLKKELDPFRRKYLADECGIDVTYVSNLKAGSDAPSYRVHRLLCSAIRIELPYYKKV